MFSIIIAIPIRLPLLLQFLHASHCYCESHISTTATNSTDASSRIPTHVFHHHCDSYTPSIIVAIPPRLPPSLRFLHAFYYYYDFYTSSTIITILTRLALLLRILYFSHYIGKSVKVLRAALRILNLKMMPTFPNPYPPNPCVLSGTIKIPSA
jgi:hypothetical protein